MKKLVLAAFLVAALLISLWFGLRPPAPRPPVAAVPVIRRHLPEAHKRVLVVPVHPLHPSPPAP